MSVKFRFRYDDALDVVGVHLVGGIVGSLLLGLFADKAVNPAGRDGVFLGGGLGLLGDQVVAVGRDDRLLVRRDLRDHLGARQGRCRAASASTEDEEDTGLDLGEHSEVAYAFAER